VDCILRPISDWFPTVYHPKQLKSNLMSFTCMKIPCSSRCYVYSYTATAVKLELQRIDRPSWMGERQKIPHFAAEVAIMIGSADTNTGAQNRFRRHSDREKDMVLLRCLR